MSSHRPLASVPRAQAAQHAAERQNLRRCPPFVGTLVQPLSLTVNSSEMCLTRLVLGLYFPLPEEDRETFGLCVYLHKISE